MKSIKALLFKQFVNAHAQIPLQLIYMQMTLVVVYFFAEQIKLVAVWLRH